MRIGRVEASIPTLVAVALAVAVGGVMVFAGATSGSAFDPHNPGWEGLSELRGEADTAETQVRFATGVGEYRRVDATGTVAIAVGSSGYAAEDVGPLRGFVEDGGTLVVAARDPEATNPVLDALGTDVELDGAPLRDEQEYDRTPDFPLVTTVANHSYVGEIRGLALNHGTTVSLADDGDARPLANSSAYSYLDHDGDGEVSDDEELAARPVVVLQSVGEGEVVVVSDPSVFINAMLERDANRAFAANLVRGHDRLLLDRTAGGVPPLRHARSVLQESPAVAGLAGLLIVVAILAWERRLHGRLRDGLRSVRGRAPSRPGETGGTARDFEAYLANRYPDLERDRLRRVLGGINTSEEKPADDDGGN